MSFGSRDANHTMTQRTYIENRDRMKCVRTDPYPNGVFDLTIYNGEGLLATDQNYPFGLSRKTKLFGITLPVLLEKPIKSGHYLHDNQNIRSTATTI